MVLKLEPFWSVMVPEEAFSSPWRDERFMVPGGNRRTENPNEINSWTVAGFHCLGALGAKTWCGLQLTPFSLYIILHHILWCSRKQRHLFSSTINFDTEFLNKTTINNTEPSKGDFPFQLVSLSAVYSQMFTLVQSKLHALNFGSPFRSRVLGPLPALPGQ